MIPFNDIHSHSYFSLLDGVSSPEEMAKRAKGHGAVALGLTDHGTTAGIFEFYFACKKNGIKPILGCELYFKEKLKDGNKNLKYFHGIFLAINEIGLKNLFYLSSIGYRPDHFEFNRPVASIDDILTHSEGLIYSTGCMDGILGASHSLPYEQVIQLLDKFHNIFKDRMYIEISSARVNTNWDSQTRTFVPIDITNYTFGDMTYTTNCLQESHNRRAIYIANLYKLPIVLGSDGHMISADLKPVQDLLITSSPTNKNGWHFNQTHALMSSIEMWEQFQSNHAYINKEIFETALQNNLNLANTIENLELKFSTLVPKYPIESHPLYKSGMTSKQLMMAIILEKGRLPHKLNYLQRLQTEIEVICDNGIADYTDYFLILYDIVEAAKRMDIMVGPGRGSAGGCLLTYLLGITSVDPIKSKLDFTRFINAGRIKSGHLPDCDLDFSDREPIINYLFQKYSENNTAAVGTFQTIKTKTALKEIIRYFKYKGEKLPNKDDIHKVTATIDIAPQMYPSELAFLEGFTDEDDVWHEGHLEQNKTLKAYLEQNEFIGDPPVDLKKLLKNLLEKPRVQGTHAGGILLTPSTMDYIIPTRYYNNIKSTQIDYYMLEKIGGMKIDILGVNTLNFINDALKKIKQNYNITLDPWNLPPDTKVFKDLSDGHSETVFQFDTDVVRPLLKAIKPQSIEDLAVITAVGRPGALVSTLEDGETVAKHFILRRQNREAVTYVDNILEPVLKETMGLPIYQESIQKIFEIIGDFSAVESDDARRAIGKKELQTMLAIKGKLFDNATSKLKWTLGKCEALWNSFIGAANYAFNKSHATFYAIIAYACAYLKHYYPLEWWSSVLSNIAPEKSRQYLSIISSVIIMPHINISGNKWIISNNKLLAPITLIKNIGEVAIQEIEKARINGHFSSFKDFYYRVNKSKVNKLTITNLIITGCFDGLPLEDNTVPIYDKPHLFIEYLYNLREESAEIPIEYQNLDNRIKKLAMRSLLLPIISYNYVEQFKDVLQAQPLYKFANNIHHLSQYPIIENFDNIKLFNGQDVVAMGLLIEQNYIHYNDKKTGDPKTMLKLTLENDCKVLHVIIWPNQLDDLSKEEKSDFRVGNLIAIHGHPKLNRYNKYTYELEYLSHICLLQGESNFTKIK